MNKTKDNLYNDLIDDKNFILFKLFLILLLTIIIPVIPMLFGINVFSGVGIHNTSTAMVLVITCITSFLGYMEVFFLIPVIVDFFVVLIQYLRLKRKPFVSKNISNENL